MSENTETVLLCECCEERPATHKVTTYDVTPTDRGEWKQYYDMWLCDECDKRKQ